MRALLAVATLLLAGCVALRASQRQEQPDTIPADRLGERIRHVFLPQPCGQINKAWLLGQITEKKAEGVIAEAHAVAEARGAQVDALNGRITAGNKNLMRIEAVLKQYGCAALEP